MHMVHDCALCFAIIIFFRTAHIKQPETAGLAVHCSQVSSFFFVGETVVWFVIFHVEARAQRMEGLLRNPTELLDQAN